VHPAIDHLAYPVAPPDDPAFFARPAELLSARGLTVASFDPRSAPMREAWSQFYETVNAGALPTWATPFSPPTS
jgi:hypothetical protein